MTALRQCVTLAAMDIAVRTEAEKDRTYRFLHVTRRILIRTAIAVWCTLLLLIATQVRTYSGTDNAGAYLGFFGHRVVVEWKGHPGICVDCD
ncbi:MAG: hypothetical protein J2P17_15425 [Mycobacterium sp.]|nr:hypothetical protein [Mycobacterium sp.]